MAYNIENSCPLFLRWRIFDFNFFHSFKEKNTPYLQCTYLESPWWLRRVEHPRFSP